jgi:hypothetical protein
MTAARGVGVGVGASVAIALGVGGCVGVSAAASAGVGLAVLVGVGVAVVVDAFAMMGVAALTRGSRRPAAQTIAKRFQSAPIRDLHGHRPGGGVDSFDAWHAARARVNARVAKAMIDGAQYGSCSFTGGSCAARILRFKISTKTENAIAK